METDPQRIPAPAVYKLFIGCILPRPIAWVSTVDTEGTALARLKPGPHCISSRLCGSHGEDTARQNLALTGRQNLLRSRAVA